MIRGDLRGVRRMVDKRGWAAARDHYGHTPLHKAVMANQEQVMGFIAEAYPELVEERDNVSANVKKTHGKRISCSILALCERLCFAPLELKSGFQ